MHSVNSDGFWKQDLDISRKYFRNIWVQSNYSHIIQIMQTRIDKMISYHFVSLSLCLQFVQKQMVGKDRAMRSQHNNVELRTRQLSDAG